MMNAPQGPCARRVSEESESSLFTSVVVCGELLFGVAKKRHASHQKALELLARYEAILSAITVLPLDDKACDLYGRLRAGLERAGQMIGPNDLWIASHALAANLTVVTDNIGEFTRVPDLAVRNWLHG